MSRDTPPATSPDPLSPPIFAIMLISAAALAYEMLLLRLFSIVLWHHFAYMVISLALLGYGVSGTFISLTQRWLQARYEVAFCGNLVGFGISTLGCYLWAQTIPFNPETVLWDWHQPLRLFIIYVLLSIPFFFAANAIALTFIRFRDNIARTYAADLFGAGLGSLGVIGLLTYTFPLAALSIIASLASISVLIAIWSLRMRNRSLWALLAIGMAICFILIGQHTTLKLSPYKPLSQMLRISGSQIVSQETSPLGLLTVVENSTVPFRHTPGASLMTRSEPPAQVAVFSDGGSMTVITDGNAPPSRYQYLDQLTWALPYHLFKPKSVLILAAGGGSEVLQAKWQSIPHIQAVELNPQLIELVRGPYDKFSGRLYDQPGVTVHVGEARGFVADTKEQFDLIQLPLLDSYALNESYSYTVEAINIYLDALKPDGYLAVSRWVNLPPRDTLKLFATAVAALKERGINTPGDHLILIRGWQTSTLLVKNGTINNDNLSALRQFTDERAFDLCWFPGIQKQETNRYNLLDTARFYQGAKSLLSPQQDQFLDRYKFNLEPPTDDQPYFFNFFKWQTLSEIFSLRGSGGMPLLEWGYLVLIATIVQALAASAVLILLPLFIWRRSRTVIAGVNKLNVLTYFMAIGLGFLFIEMAFIQRFILFLNHPLYAAAVVVTGFLIFAGLGSAYAQRIDQSTQGIRYAVFGIALLSLTYLFLLPLLFEWLIGLPILAKIAASLVLIMPLAFCMGLPFPLALAGLGQQAPDLLPWAWGVNGCASVISAVLATLLAIQWGFTTVILSAIVLYVIALTSAPTKT